MNIDINININIIPILKWYDMVSYSIVHQITHAVHQFKDTQEKSAWPIILCQVSSCARPECHSSRSQGIMLYRIIASTYQVYVYLKSIVLWQCIHDMIQHGIAFLKHVMDLCKVIPPRFEFVAIFLCIMSTNSWMNRGITCLTLRQRQEPSWSFLDFSFPGYYSPLPHF